MKSSQEGEDYDVKGIILLYRDEEREEEREK